MNAFLRMTRGLRCAQARYVQPLMFDSTPKARRRQEISKTGLHASDTTRVHVRPMKKTAKCRYKASTGQYPWLSMTAVRRTTQEDIVGEAAI